jgi:hypothetical protein
MSADIWGYSLRCSPEIKDFWGVNSYFFFFLFLLCLETCAV